MMMKEATITRHLVNGAELLSSDPTQVYVDVEAVDNERSLSLMYQLDINLPPGARIIHIFAFFKWAIWMTGPKADAEGKTRWMLSPLNFGESIYHLEAAIDVTTNAFATVTKRTHTRSGGIPLTALDRCNAGAGVPSGMRVLLYGQPQDIGNMVHASIADESYLKITYEYPTGLVIDVTP